jgi:hypothetical protein
MREIGLQGEEGLSFFKKAQRCASAEASSGPLSRPTITILSGLTSSLQDCRTSDGDSYSVVQLMAPAPWLI